MHSKVLRGENVMASTVHYGDLVGDEITADIGHLIVIEGFESEIGVIQVTEHKAAAFSVDIL